MSPANSKQIAPAGWRVPTDPDWNTLRDYLIANGYNWDGTTIDNKVAKSTAAKTDWASSGGAGAIGNNIRENNSSGFSALPGGCRSDDGGFDGRSFDAYWWSATEFGASHAWGRNLNQNPDYILRFYYFKGSGFSARLVRDT